MNPNAKTFYNFCLLICLFRRLSLSSSSLTARRMGVRGGVEHMTNNDLVICMAILS